MSESATGVVHTEVMELRATPEQVRAFILTPERILDYYPQPIEGGVLEPGQAIWCRGEIGVSILERVAAESSDSLVVVKVTTAFGLEAPYTRERIEANVGFTMVEDWAIEAIPGGTRLTKSWRDLETPAGDGHVFAKPVREGGIHESPQLVEGWNAAAAAAGD